MRLKDLPGGARPRNKRLARLRTGVAGKGVLQLAAEQLGPQGFGGIAGMLQADASELRRVKGLGPTKRAERVAVMELARRALAQQLREREVLSNLSAMTAVAAGCDEALGEDLISN